MTAFAYRAVHASGRVRKGRMEAANENELAFILKQLDLELLHARAERENLVRACRRRFEDRLRPGDTQALCRQMADLLEAGLPLDEALRVLIEATPPGALQTRLTAIAQAVQAGASAHDAFAAQGRLLDPVLLALLEAGEKSGDLGTAWDRLARQAKKQNEIRRDLARAVRYPLFLACVAAGVTSFMMAYVVPEIVSFLEGLGTPLPFSTRALMSCASFFSALWWSLPLAALAAWASLVFARRASAEAARITDHWLLALPGAGAVWRALALARFAASFSLLVTSGLALPHALRTAAKATGNRALTAQLEAGVAQVESGCPLSVAIGPLFPPMTVQRLKIGEKSGRLTRALDDIARDHEAKAHEAVETFLGTLEPALTLFVGGLLAWIVLAVLGPVYGSLGQFSGAAG